MIFFILTQGRQDFYSCIEIKHFGKTYNECYLVLKKLKLANNEEMETADLYPGERVEEFMTTNFVSRFLAQLLPGIFQDLIRLVNLLSLF